jgi:hypothetical protein
MIHDKRRFGIVTVASVGQLVEDLKEHSWTLCTGFALQDLLLLNDAFSEDGAQEYAVIRQGRQIESLTVSWMSRAEWLCRKFCSGGRAGAVAPVWGGITRPGSRTVRPQ